MRGHTDARDENRKGNLMSRQLTNCLENKGAARCAANLSQPEIFDQGCAWQANAFSKDAYRQTNFGR